MKHPILKKEAGGALTAEAALVMPLVIGVLLFLVFLGLYLYDVCLVSAVSGETAAFAANEVRCGYTVDASSVQNTANELLSGKTVFIQSFSGEATIDKAVTFQGSGTRGGANGLLTTLLGHTPWAVSCVFQDTAEAPEDKIRLALSVSLWKEWLTSGSASAAEESDS